MGWKGYPLSQCLVEILLTVESRCSTSSSCAQDIETHISQTSGFQRKDAIKKKKQCASACFLGAVQIFNGMAMLVLKAAHKRCFIFVYSSGTSTFLSMWHKKAPVQCDGFMVAP